MKKLFVGILLSLLTVSAVLAVGCAKSVAPDYKRFDSFAPYKNFDEGVVAIDVQWDLGGSWDEFTVTDAEQVNQIVNLFKNTIMKKGEGPAGGDCHGVDFVYGDGTKVGVSLFTIVESGQYYYYTSSEVRHTVRKIGRINNELTTNISDFTGYKGFHKNVSKINVSWYKVNDGFVNFTIDESDKIEAIQNLYLHTEFAVGEKRDDAKSEIEFVYNTNETLKLGLTQIWDDGYYFDYSDYSVFEYIEQLVNQM